MKRVLGAIRRADERYHMIENGDRVLIGVSGGKDSLLLMEAMKLYQKFSYTSFEVEACMLDLGLKEQDTGPIEELAERIGMPFTVEKTDIGKVVFEYREERSPCALCAKLRRGALNTFAVNHGCNKVALGHNREDVIETFFLSLLYEGRMNTFAPVTYLGRRDVTLIRPLIFLPEKYALGVARQRQLPVLPPHCNIAGTTKREEAKEVIRYLCTIQPQFEEKFMHALSTTETYGLWDRMRLKPEGGRNHDKTPADF